MLVCVCDLFVCCVCRIHLSSEHLQLLRDTMKYLIGKIANCTSKTEKQSLISSKSNNKWRTKTLSFTSVVSIGLLALVRFYLNNFGESDDSNNNNNKNNTDNKNEKTDGTDQTTLHLYDDVKAVRTKAAKDQNKPNPNIRYSVSVNARLCALYMCCLHIFWV